MFNEIFHNTSRSPSIWQCEEERFESKELAFTVQKIELKFLEYKEKLGTDILFRVNGLKLYTIISDLELIESVTMNFKIDEHNTWLLLPITCLDSSGKVLLIPHPRT